MTNETEDQDEDPLTFEVYLDNDTQYRWRARTNDAADEIIADSGEGYESYLDCVMALQRIRTHAEQASITELLAVEPQPNRSFSIDLTVEMSGGEE